MRIAILECSTKSSSDAHMRQSQILKQYFRKKGDECDIYDIKDMVNAIDEKFDIIIKSYSTFYEDYNSEITICNNNKHNARFYFITNEYTIQASNVLNKTNKNGVNWNIITNFDKKAITNTKFWKNKYSLNLNCLFYNIKECQNKKYKVCYYGTYRKDRKKYFKKYFVSKNIILSTSPKSVKKFMKDGCIFKPCKRFIWGHKKDTLGLFKYSLYIEDEWIHNNFHNLADRFYEAMSNQTVTLFDKSCIHTLENSELKDKNYKDFIIDSFEEIEQRDYDKDWEKQKLWLDELQKQKENVLEEIYRIITC